MSDGHFAAQLDHFMPGFLSYSVAVFLKGQSDLSLPGCALAIEYATSRFVGMFSGTFEPPVVHSYSHAPVCFL
jgi:hypothetical protein